MAGIARKVELFNLAYKLAWAHVDENPALKSARAPYALSTSIRRQLAAGADDVVVIAATAIKELGDSSFDAGSRSE